MSNRIASFVLLIAAAVLAACATDDQRMASGKPEYMVVGVDNKVIWDDNGKLLLLPPGKDSVTIVDIGSDPANPRIVANLPLMNSIFGPPTNLAITPNGQLALVANSMDWVQDGGNWKPSPDNKLYVIDLTTSPPTRIDTVTVGKQPSGMSINRAGDLVLIANRADNSISVLAIQGKQVRLVDTVVIGEHVAHVAFTPDGKRALTADNGNNGGSDGNVDTVSVIDLEAQPARVIDKVVVGDAPEGFAISPTGKLAVAVLLRGSNNAKTEWFYHRNGSVVVLKIDGNTVTNTGTLVRLPGGPASMRGRRQ